MLESEFDSCEDYGLRRKKLCKTYSRIQWCFGFTFILTIIALIAVIVTILITESALLNIAMWTLFVFGVMAVSEFAGGISLFAKKALSVDKVLEVRQEIAHLQYLLTVHPSQALNKEYKREWIKQYLKGESSTIAQINEYQEVQAERAYQEYTEEMEPKLHKKIVKKIAKQRKKLQKAEKSAIKYVLESYPQLFGNLPGWRNKE